jgi:hypothetical protein
MKKATGEQPVSAIISKMVLAALVKQLRILWKLFLNR